MIAHLMCASTTLVFVRYTVFSFEGNGMSQFKFFSKIAACSVLSMLVCSPPQAALAADALTQAQAQFEVRLLKRAVTTLHPALTKYNSADAMAAAITRFESRGNAARTASEMYLAATELAASIRCGHTWTNTLNQTGAAKAALMEARNKLPLLLVPVESRWLVTASAVPNLQKGDEIVSVNGTAGADIVTTLMPYLRADGSSDGKRLQQLSHDRDATSMMDLVWPLLSPPVQGKYALQVRRTDGRIEAVHASAMSFAERRDALKALGVAERSETNEAAKANGGWTLSVKDGIATMTLPTFSFWRSNFDWAKFIDSSFARLNAEKIGHLVIDIRANEGGDGAINRALMAHLLRSPFTWPETRAISAYERVPYSLVKYLETWDYDFFDRTGKVEKLGEREFVVKPKQAVNRTITPVASPYSGKTYVLVGAENSSATFQLASLIKDSKAATLIGQRTGGNLRGLNGGELLWVTLPHSGVAFDIPLIASNPVVAQPDASVLPDIEVQRTFAARAAARDLEMEALLRALHNQ
jgi:hypothetical protein